MFGGRGESREGRQGTCQVARGHFPLPKALPSSPLLPMHNQASTYFLLLSPSKGTPACVLPTSTAHVAWTGKFSFQD